MSIDPKIPLRQAIEICGTQTALADALGIKKPSISDWKAGGLEFLPPLHAYRFREIHADRFRDLFPSSTINPPGGQ